MAWKDCSRQDPRWRQPACGRPSLQAGTVHPIGQMGKLRLQEASESQQWSRTRTQDLRPRERPFRCSYRYLGCCLSPSLCRQEIGLGGPGGAGGWVHFPAGPLPASGLSLCLLLGHPQPCPALTKLSPGCSLASSVSLSMQWDSKTHPEEPPWGWSGTGWGTPLRKGGLLGLSLSRRCRPCVRAGEGTGGMARVGCDQTCPLHTSPRPAIAPLGPGSSQPRAAEGEAIRQKRADCPLFSDEKTDSEQPGLAFPRSGAVLEPHASHSAGPRTPAGGTEMSRFKEDQRWDRWPECHQALAPAMSSSDPSVLVCPIPSHRRGLWGPCWCQALAL